MKCSKCGYILSPEEKNCFLTAIAEGIKNQTAICDDCIEDYNLTEEESVQKDELTVR